MVAEFLKVLQLLIDRVPEMDPVLPQTGHAKDGLIELSISGPDQQLVGTMLDKGKAV